MINLTKVVMCVEYHKKILKVKRTLRIRKPSPENSCNLPRVFISLDISSTQCPQFGLRFVDTRINVRRATYLGKGLSTAMQPMPIGHSPLTIMLEFRRYAQLQHNSSVLFPAPKYSRTYLYCGETSFRSIW